MSQFAIYKPNKTGNGAASQLKYSDRGVFWEFAIQSGTNEKGNYIFNWKNKITIKLGANDIGPILTTLSNYDKPTSLFHQTEKGTSTLKITKYSDTIGIQVTKKVNDQPDVAKVQHLFTVGEVAILKELFKHLIVVSFEKNQL